MTWSGATSDGDPSAPVRVHVLPAQPGLPPVPAAALLGAAGGTAAWGPAESAIFGRAAAIAARELVPVADPAGADVLLHPHDALDWPAAALGASRAAAEAGKPLALYSASDEVRPSAIRWGTLWRTSAFRSKLRDHERIAAGDVPDLVRERAPGLPDALGWSDRPAVGFIGHVASGARSLRYLRKGWQAYHGFTLRERVLRSFERSGGVETRFIRRTGNLGPPMAGVASDESRRRMRAEYVDSVFGCGYSLCMRGAGNWSFRFFETLSAGRIPVLIDTDSALPLEDRVDWSLHVCRVPVGRLPEAAEIVAAHHRGLGPAGFREVQLRNRELWLGALEPGRFIADSLARTAGRRHQA